MKDVKLKMWNVVPQDVRDDLTLILFDDFSGEYGNKDNRFFYQGFLAMHGLVRGYTDMKELKLTEAQAKIIDTVMKYEKLEPAGEDDTAFAAGAALYRGMMPKR